MVIKRSTGERIFEVFNVLFMLFLLFITIYPFWYVIACSFSDSNNLIGDKGLMFAPLGFSLDAYRLVFENPNIGVGYMNTVLIVITGTAINLFMTSIGAFLVSRRDFAAKKLMLTMILITMYFGGGLIPTFLWVNNFLKLGNTYLALILPGAISAYNLIIMRNNFEEIPRNLEEAAKIDGANEIMILFRIILPLSMPIIAVMILFYGVAHWNSWFQALIYIRSKSLYPLQLVLREILLLNNADTMATGSMATDRYNIGEGIKYATIIVATVPILCVYPFIQKYFVKGVMVGAVKG
jgi:putative aldouronate transport system permease protein